MTEPARSLEVLHLGGSSLAGRTQVFPGPRIRLGRRPDNDVAFDPELDRKVSGHHAEAVLDGETVTIADLGTPNGVCINGVRIAGPTRVGPDDRVRLGQSGPELRLRAVAAAQAPIGEETLAKAIDRAAVAQRHGARRALLVAGLAAAVLGGITAWWLAGRGDAQVAQVAQALAEAPRAPDWAGLAARYRESVFLLVAEGTKGEGGIGTGFVVDARGILATNAHVAEMLEKLPQRAAVQNHTGKPFAIARVTRHPGFSGPSSPDVALVQLDASAAPLPTLVPLPLADDAALAALGVGTALGTLGYPGELAASYLAGADVVRAVFPGALATFKDGLVSRLTDYQSRACPPEAVRVVQHSASLSGGTSGSPMFTSDGRVVAINNAGLDAQVLVADPSGSGRIGAARMPSGAQIGFAIRADELARFIAATGW